MKSEIRYKSYAVAVILIVLVLKLGLDLKSREYFQQTAFATYNLDVEYLEKNLLTLDQSDPSLIQYTRIRHLNPPSELEYRLEGGGKADAFSKVVAEIFNNKKNGIFIEAGANDGDTSSHTIYLEKELNWKGLLVECNPKLIPKLRSLNRKAWIAGVCIAPGTNPGILNFSVPVDWSLSGTFGKQWNINLGGKRTVWKTLEVETMPLFTIISALKWTEIDFFSFDIEGSELSVLKNFPFDKIIFKLLIIEIFFYNDAQKKELDELLAANNYHFVSNFDAFDKVYVHNSAKDQLNLERFKK